MIEVRHFRLLDAIERSGSLSGAARLLGYSQPAITQQVQLLERQLETPVLLRVRGGVRFTEAGEVLLRHGRGVLDATALARSEVEAVAGLRAGRVRIASFASAAATLLPVALAGVRQRHPGLGFSLVEHETDAALEALRAGDCDLAIVYSWEAEGVAGGPALLPDERGESLLVERVAVALPREHPHAARESVDLAELRDETWVAGCAVCRRSLLEMCERTGFAPAIGFEIDDYVAMQGLVAAGLGVALVTDLMLVAARADRAFVLRPLRPEVRRTVRVVTTEALAAVPGIGQTIAALREAAERVIDGNRTASMPAEA